ncbi:MAG: CPBP family intramembrane glutamic endopeptidase [Oscillospiraceae bacterium]
MNTKINVLFIKIIAILFSLQLSRIFLKSLVFVFIPPTPFSDVIVSATIIVILTILIVLYAKKRGIHASFYPHKHKVFYAVASIAAVALLISTPIITGDISPETLIVLFYSVIVIPIFEELIFRGYLWNLFKNKFNSEFKLYLVTTVLFAIWHLGYIDSIATRTATTGLPFAMLMKVVTGLCFGIVLGLLRYKTKSCYATILLHGVMNIFGR